MKRNPTHLGLHSAQSTPVPVNTIGARIMLAVGKNCRNFWKKMELN